MMDKKRLKSIVLSVFLIIFLGFPHIHYVNVKAANNHNHLSASINLSLNNTNPELALATTKQHAAPTSEANSQDFRPTNSNYHPQWNHNVMNIGQAWEDGYTGAGVTIAILDTGFYHRHEDLEMIGGYSVFSDDPWSNDHSGHGTHIAGIIGARPGTPYQGVAPGADLYGIKIYNSHLADENGVTTDVASVIRGIRHAIDIQTDIIVISSGLSYHDDELHQIIQEAYNQDILIIAASGNGNPTINYPAAYPEVVAITAIDEQLNPARDIVYGQENEFSAPGVTIGGLSIPSSPYGYPYIYMSGSSQAVPHAAGLAAIYMEKYGVAGQEVREIMRDQAVNIGDEGLYGHGLLRYEIDEDQQEPDDNETTDPETTDNGTDDEDVLPTIGYSDNTEENQSVQKPTSSREATEEDDENDEEEEVDSTSFYQVNTIIRNNQGIIAEDALSYVEDGGTIEITLNNVNSLYLSDEQVRDIRNRNISLILLKNDVTWTIPPSNFLPGNIVFRFFEGSPTGIATREGQMTEIYTLSIYQTDKRSDSYPGWMDVRFNVNQLDNVSVQNINPYYWDKNTKQWEELTNYEITEDSATLRTRYTSAVGFFDSSVTAEEPDEPEVEEIESEEVTENDDDTTGMIPIIISVVIISLFVVRLILYRK